MFAGVVIDGLPGRTYRIESTPDLVLTNNWLFRTNLSLPVSPLVWIDYDSPSTTNRFYRATILP